MTRWSSTWWAARHVEDRQAPRLPTVVLGTVPSPAHSSETQNPTQSLLLSSLASASKAELSSLLQEAGLARYAERVAQAMAGIRDQGVEQTLYTGLLDALGYWENRAAFETLGRMLPIALVRAVYHTYPSEHRLEALHALVITAAGMKPPDARWLALVGRATMDRKAWKTAGVRPGNHPLRRLQGLAALLDRHVAPGLGASLAQRVAAGATELVASLTVAAPGGLGGSALVGKGRALEIAVNVALPVLDAWAEAAGDQTLRARCRQLYQSLPALQENTITREARRLAGGSYLPKVHLGACRQQGLLHLYWKAVAR